MNERDFEDEIVVVLCCVGILWSEEWGNKKERTTVTVNGRRNRLLGVEWVENILV
jgi:ABC-type Fe3+ transport system permease subunit